MDADGLGIPGPMGAGERPLLVTDPLPAPAGPGDTKGNTRLVAALIVVAFAVLVAISALSAHFLLGLNLPGGGDGAAANFRPPNAAKAGGESRSAFCDGVTDVGERDKCYEWAAASSRSEAMCGMVSGRERRQDCLRKMAVLLNDSEICARIGDRAQMDGCYAGLAAKLKDPRLCGMVEGEDAKAACLSARI